MRNLRKGARRVEIEWIDSASRSEWHAEEESLRDFDHPDHQLCISLGYVLREDSQKLMLAMSFAAQPDGRRLVGDVVTIPKIAIKRVKELK